MLPLKHKRTTISLAPPIFYVAKKLAIKKVEGPYCDSGHKGSHQQILRGMITMIVSLICVVFLQLFGKKIFSATKCGKGN